MVPLGRLSDQRASGFEILGPVEVYGVGENDSQYRGPRSDEFRPKITKAGVGVGGF